MARKLRFIPDPHTLVSITCRTVQGRFLFLPGPTFNDRFLCILGRAQRRHNLTLIAISVLSNHFHVLAVPESAKQLSGFMRDLKSKLAREVNRLAGWSGPVFDRRYEMTVVTEEEAAQVERLGYVLGQSVQEGLVERVSEWPGVHSAAALIAGTPLVGHWFDRTRECAARNQREEITPLQFATEESVILTPPTQ
ncbi:MAG TPA: transposase [Thermoanaerobaculia bacterium]|jgi:REP element-mobilizing transposase RayT|nr:transposase [Thermoanaerobaculia bacterium]